MNNQWGTKIVGIPYRGGGPAAQALAANQVQVTRFGVGNFLGLFAGRQGEGAGGHAGQALAGAAERADLRRGRLGRLSGPGLVGSGRAEGHAAGDRRSSRAYSEPVQRSEVHRRSSTSRRWCRRRPTPRALRRS